MSQFELWTHGVAALPERVDLPPPQRAAFGAVFPMPADGSAWFHIPLPGLGSIASWPGSITRALLNTDLGPGGFVDRIELRQGERLVEAWPDLRLTGRVRWSRIVLAGEPAPRAAPTLAIHVRWSAPAGHLILRGAGIGYRVRRPDQRPGDDPWTDWQSGWPAGPPVGGRPAIASWGPQRVDAFGRTADSRLLHAWRQGDASGPWGERGRDIVGDPVAVSWGAGRLDIFARNHRDGLFHQWHANGWGATEGLGGHLAHGATPAATSWGEARLDVFARSRGDGLLHWWWPSQNGWSIADIGGRGRIAGDPVAISDAQQNLHVFAIAHDGEMLHWWATGDGPFQTESLGGVFVPGDAPAAVCRRTRHVDVFARDPAGALRHLAFPSDRWGAKSWADLGGDLDSAPVAIPVGPDRIDVFARSRAGTLAHLRWQQGAPTPTWRDLGGRFAGEVAAVYAPPKVWVMVIDGDGRLRRRDIDQQPHARPQPGADVEPTAPLPIPAPPAPLPPSPAPAPDPPTAPDPAPRPPPAARPRPTPAPPEPPPAPEPPAPEAPEPSGGSASTAPEPRAPAAEPAPQTLDLNAATAAELDTLPGIGPALAEAVTRWRAAHGGFRAIEQLTEISGIGPATLDRLRPLLTIGPPPEATPPAPAADPAARVDLRTATHAELVTLPGIGPALAADIIEWRDANPPLRSLDALRAIRGIGPATIARIEPLVTVGAAAAGDRADEAADTRLDLGVASAAALESLPGIGPALAADIIAWREEHGPFATVDALTSVRGIGAATVARLRDRVTVGAVIEPDDHPPEPERLDLNAATVEELVELPGVGPVLAAAIISWREAHGPFSDLAALGAVRGIGPATLERLGPMVAL